MLSILQRYMRNLPHRPPKLLGLVVMIVGVSIIVWSLPTWAWLVLLGGGLLWFGMSLYKSQ